jgi:hypothetical protein
MEEQCRGVTKSGRRCRNRTNLVDGYCRVHRDQAVSHETPTESVKKRQVERRVEEPGAAVFDEQVAPAVSRAQEREAKPAPARPSEPSQPHRTSAPPEQHPEERGWPVGLLSGALLALVAVALALVGRHRRGR